MRTVSGGIPKFGLGDGLIIALLLFVTLSLLGILIVVIDFGDLSSNLRDSLVGYSLASLLAIGALLATKMAKPTLAAAAGIVGGVTPIVASRDLLGSFGLKDLWIGQSWTLMVLLPLLLGLGAALLTWSNPR